MVADNTIRSIASCSNSPLVMSKIAVLKSHDAKLLFPPCYPAAAGEGESPALSTFFSDCPIDDVHSPDTAGVDGMHSTTMTTLTLIAPELGMGPTCSTSLISMNYIIDIILSVKDPRGSGRSLSSEFRIPIALSSSEARSTAPKVEPCSPRSLCHRGIEDAEPPQYVR